jgi:hypothetical protein
MSGALNEDDVPAGYTPEQWDNLTCCACYGCKGHEHSCHYSDEERAARVRYHDEALTIALTKGAGTHVMSDGTTITVRMGPGNTSG